MYTKAMPTFSCGFHFHRLNVNASGKKRFSSCFFRTVFNNKNGSTAMLPVANVSDFQLKRRFSLFNSRLTAVNRLFTLGFYSNSNSRSLILNCNFEFCKSDADMRFSCSRRMFVTAPQPKKEKVGATFVSHCILKQRSGWSPVCCCFYSATVEGQGKPKNELLDLEMVAKKMLESAKKYDVMAGSVPLRKAVVLLEVLHRQGFILDDMTNILCEQLPFLLDPESLTVLTELLLSHGFRHNSIIQFLKNLPALGKNTSLKHLKNLVDDSISFLRIAGFKERDISSFLMLEPRIFFTDSKLLNSVISQMKGLFSAADSLIVIKNSPNVFLDPWDETMKKFHYVHFVMGYKQPAMLKSFFFKHSQSYIVNRHLFLLRAGFFHSVKAKDDPKLNPNPPLSDVFNTPNTVFARKFGGFSPEEYNAYLDMRDVEREEEDVDDDTSDEEDESEEEEENNIRNKTMDRPFKRK